MQINSYISLLDTNQTRKIYKNKIKKKINRNRKSKIIKNNCNLIKCSLISFLLLFIIICIILFREKPLKIELKNTSILQTKNEKNSTDLYNKENEKEKSKDEEFKNLQESFNNAKDFLDKGIKGILIQDKQKFVLSENPIVSAVIPLYNCKNFILRAIRSIQNQNIYNLEIILINDFSTDSIIPVIDNIKKEDPRIKLINNKKNMGTLYSRSIGTLAAKGKYIFPLDNDDMFLDKDVFEIITNIAESGYFDI